MKKALALLTCTLFLLAGCTAAASSAVSSEAVSTAPVETPPVETNETAAPGTADPLSALVDYLEANPTALNCVNTGVFSADAAAAPSDEELTRMLDVALSIGSAHSLTPSHFIVIRDYDEQVEILGEANVTPGTVTVLVLADTLRDQEHHEAEYNEWYSQMYYGIFDAGSSMAFLHLAATSLGYGTHFYAALNIPVGGEVDQSNGGRFELIQGNNWDIEKYMVSKDESVAFTHTIGLHSFTTGEQTINAEGNLTLLCTVVIGSVDDEVDAVAAATTGNKPANYNFWDPQDGASYGSSVEPGTVLTLPGAASDDDVDAEAGATVDGEAGATEAAS